ncbi:MAG TPA: hypothetical protein VL947_13115 [Cytophagales bacterium]|nr:hypothetical protein [Cytophagales bacterium]
MFFRKLAYWLGYIPFKLNFFIIAFILSLGFYWTKNNYFLPDLQESQKLLFELVFKIFWVFSLLVLGLAVVTLLLSWAYLFLIKSNTKSGFAKVLFGVDGFQAEAGMIPFRLSFNSLIRPFLGVIKARVVFSDYSVTDELQLAEDQFTKSKFLRSGIYSSEGIFLVDRRKYEIHRIMIFFEDMFRIFSLPYTLEFERDVYTVPPKATFEDIKIQPNKTTEQTVRIDTPQKVQGELFNYKNFESGDDIRRIVWKIFAKNRELVIRVPEIIDPHASELEIFTSFYNTFPKESESALGKYLLNYYKDRLRVVYESAKANGYLIRHIPDQVVDQGMSTNADLVLYHLSLSAWHNDQHLDQYVGNRKGGIVCISSLVSIDDLKMLLGKKDASYLIFYTRLSDVFKSKASITWAKLFIRTEESRDTVFKRKWLFAGIRTKLLKNERLIESELQSSQSKIYII